MTSARWLALWSILTVTWKSRCPLIMHYHPHPACRGETREPVSLSLCRVCLSESGHFGRPSVCNSSPLAPGAGAAGGTRSTTRSSHTTHSQHKVYHSSVLARRGGEAEEERARPRRGGSQVRDRGAQWPPVLRSPSAVAVRRLRAAAQRVERGTGGAASGRGAILGPLSVQVVLRNHPLK